MTNKKKGVSSQTTCASKEELEAAWSVITENPEEANTTS